MMIKGSLLRSIPIVKRFLASDNGAKNWGFGGLEVENFNLNNQTSLGNHLHRNTLSGAKTVSIDAKMWSPKAGKK